MQEKPRNVEPSARVCLDRVAVVLFRPQLAENIGAVARAACNMGINRLVAVQAQDLDRDRMARMATGPAAQLLTRMEVHDDLALALSPFQYIVGTTARLGGVRNDYFSPREMAARLVDISAANDVALLFGPENWGLTNDELPFCHALVTIPTADCSSLNLAQAVMVMAYELFTAGERQTPPRPPPGQLPGAGIHVRHAPGDPGQDQLHQPPEPGALDVQRPPALRPPRPPGPGGPGDQRHLPPDRLVRGQALGRVEEIVNNRVTGAINYLTKNLRR